MTGALVFLLAGLGMVAFNGPLARRLTGFGRAWGDRVRVECIRRWFFWQYYQPWAVTFGRVGLVVMGLLWALVGLVLIVLIALGVRVSS